MVYIIAGVVFLMIFGLEIFYKEIWLRDVSPDGNNTNNTLEGYTILEKTSEQVRFLNTYFNFKNAFFFFFFNYTDQINHLFDN